MTAERRSGGVRLEDVQPTRPVHWFLFPLWPASGLTVVYGRGGIGKSTLLESLLAAPLTVGGFQPVTDYSLASAEYRPAPVPFLAPADPRTVERKMKPGWILHYATDSMSALHANVEAAKGDPARLQRMLWDKETTDIAGDLARAADTLGKGGNVPVCLILDTVESMVGEHNSNAEIRRFFEPFAQFAERHAVVMVLHSRKGDDGALFSIEHLRGASAWSEVARHCIELAKDRKGNLWAAVTKSNVGPSMHGALRYSRFAVPDGPRARWESDWEPLPTDDDGAEPEDDDAILAECFEILRGSGEPVELSRLEAMASSAGLSVRRFKHAYRKTYRTVPRGPLGGVVEVRT